MQVSVEVVNKIIKLNKKTVLISPHRTISSPHHLIMDESRQMPETIHSSNDELNLSKISYKPTYC